VVTIVARDLRSVVGSVVDPEIPVLTIDDLGILRSVERQNGRVVVTITPTYSGCPAMRQIEDDIASALVREGVADYEIKVTHNPAWTTAWMTDDGRRKLADFGIAPPTTVDAVLCPRCDTSGPRMIARFGSTACKALMVCGGCGEPFDYFKQF
jgi:ring-1,2-phenylacetyl-CoA epoxidase subunit PaaD